MIIATAMVLGGGRFGRDRTQAVAANTDIRLRRLGKTDAE